ncbi:MAG: hypothetical protein AAGI38_12775 [Bacteroidota bacterium]
MSFDFTTPMNNVLGTQEDMAFVAPDATWLHDSEVKTDIILQNGMWQVFLVFVGLDSPLHLFRRKIQSYSSQKKAQMFGEIYRRSAARDERGNLKTDMSQLDLPQN